MKDYEEIKSDLLATLWELQNDCPRTESTKTMLETKLRVLNEVLDEDVPEEYWEQISEVLEG